jgi:hypothetical protein
MTYILINLTALPSYGELDVVLTLANRRFEGTTMGPALLPRTDKKGVYRFSSSFNVKRCSQCPDTLYARLQAQREIGLPSIFKRH